MGVKLNILNVLLMILFIIGIILSAFLLYNLPGTLSKESLIIDMDEMPILLSVLYKTNWIIGSTFGLGLISLLLIIFSGKARESKNFSSGSVRKNNTSDNKEEVGDETVESDIETKEYEGILSEKIPLEEQSNKLLSVLCKQLEASQAAVYFTKKVKDKRFLELSATYAYILADSQTLTYEFGEGLVGQAAKTGNASHIKAVPEGYIEIFSGLGHSKPGELLIIPIKKDKEVISVAEIATFKPLLKNDIRLAEKVFALYGAHLIKSKVPGKSEKEEIKSDN